MKTIFGDNRILGENDPEKAVLAGRAIGSCFDRIAIGRDGEKRKSELALISGLISSGADVVTLEECLETELFFASNVCDCALCLYIKDDPLLKTDVRAQGGITLSGRDRNALIRALEKDTDNEKSGKPEGTLTKSDSLKSVYRNKISRIFPKNSKYSIEVARSGQHGKKIFSRVNGNEELIISISSDGTKASAFSKKSGFVSMEELTMICCLDRFERGEDAALPFSFPHIVNGFAEGFDRKVYRYYFSPEDDSDSHARELALRQKFTLDGVYLAASALRLLAEKEMDFVQIRKYIPGFYTSKRFVELDKDRTKRIFERFKSRLTPDGASFARNSSRVVMQPSATGKGIWLSADSFSMETASELCANIEEKLKKGNF